MWAHFRFGNSDSSVRVSFALPRHRFVIVERGTEVGEQKLLNRICSTARQSPATRKGSVLWKPYEHPSASFCPTVLCREEHSPLILPPITPSSHHIHTYPLYCPSVYNHSHCISLVVSLAVSLFYCILIVTLSYPSCSISRSVSLSVLLFAQTQLTKPPPLFCITHSSTSHSATSHS